MIDKCEVVTIAKQLFTIEILLSHVTIENMQKIVDKRKNVVCNRSIAIYNKKNEVCKIPIDNCQLQSLFTIVNLYSHGVFFTKSKALKNILFPPFQNRFRFETKHLLFNLFSLKIRFFVATANIETSSPIKIFSLASNVFH